MKIRYYLRDKYVNQDGKSPLIMEVYYKRGSRHYQTVMHIAKEHWMEGKMQVKKSYHNADITNKMLVKKRNDVESYIIECELNSVEPDMKAYFNEITDIPVLSHEDKILYLYDAIIEYAHTLEKQNKIRSSRTVMSLYNCMVYYDKDIPVSDLKMSWCKGYEGYLMGKGNTVNTIKNKFSIINTALNSYVKEEKIPYNPIQSYTVKTTVTRKKGLALDEFNLLKDAVLPDHMQLARDAWVFSCYSRGIRATDLYLLKWDNIKGNILEYRMHKNSKIIKMKLSKEAMIILDRYRGRSEYIFPVLNRTFTNTNDFWVYISGRTSIMNKLYRKIGDHLGITTAITTHVARHTFATLASMKGVDSNIIQKLLAHSSVMITEKYIRDLTMDEDLNDATDKVFE